MRYTNKKARDAFSGLDENYDRPLALLEQSFRTARLDIEFECDIAADKTKIVSIYMGGFLRKQVSIDHGPAAAVWDVIEGVRL